MKVPFALNPFDLLLGKDSSLRDRIFIILFGLSFGLFFFYTMTEGKITQSNWVIFIQSILVMDIGAGLISNTRNETREAWKPLGRRVALFFIIIHLTLYPLIWLLLSYFDNNFQIIEMWVLVVLILKTSFFGEGQFRKYL